MSEPLQPLPATEKSELAAETEMAHLESEQIAPISPTQQFGQIKTLRKFWKTTIICILAGWNACADGFLLTIPGNVIAMPGFINQFGIMYEGVLQLDAKTVSMWGAVYTAGYIAILLCGSYPIDYFGRKWCILSVQVFLVASCLCQNLAKTSGVWAVGRLFDGLSCGMNQAVAGSYVSELAPTNARGSLLAVYQLWFAFGQFTAAISTQIVSKMPDDKWRHAVYSQWVMIGVGVLIWTILPESPRWLAVNGKHDKAKAVLNRLNGKVQGYDVEAEYNIILVELEEGRNLANQASRWSYWAIFKGTNLRRLLISWGPFAWQQWIGVPVIFGYTAYFFSLAGLKNTFTAVVAVYLILLIFVGISFYVVEKIGRRPLLLGGGVGMIGCLLIVGGMGSIKSQTTTTGNVLIAFSCIWVALYALTAGPVGYVYLGETSTVLLRARSVSVAAAGTGMLNLIVNYCTPLMLAPTGANWGVEGTSFFYAGTGFIGLVLVYFFVPETKGRSYAELDELFDRKVHARDFRKTKTSVQEQAETVAKV